MKFRLDGPPTPLARPRMASSRRSLGGGGKVYDPQRHQKLLDGLKIARQYTGPLLTIPVLLTVEFHFAIPRSYSKSKKADTLGQYHTFKPDLSNLIKYIEDLCTGIVYVDDALIAKIIATKVYSEESYTEFTISSLTACTS
jgi:Holliday junction resolvase RusA-like endonuclease